MKSGNSKLIENYRQEIQKRDKRGGDLCREFHNEKTKIFFLFQIFPMKFIAISAIHYAIVEIKIQKLFPYQHKTALTMFSFIFLRTLSKEGTQKYKASKRDRKR